MLFFLRAARCGWQLLRRGDSDGVIDGFIDMRTRGPKPNRATHALAARAAADRKATWNGLRNLMRRNWLKIPWNAHAASGALVAYVRAGNLRAAAGVVAHMQATKIPLRREPLEALLWYASTSLGDGPTSRKVFDALCTHAAFERQAEEGVEGEGGEEGGPRSEAPDESGWVGVGPLLLALPHLPATERTPLLLAALRGTAAERVGGVAPDEEVRLQAALALLGACEGRPDDAVAWLLALHAEGVDLRTLDADGSLARLVDGLLPTALRSEPLSMASLLEPTASSASVAAMPPADALPTEAKERSSGRSGGLQPPQQRDRRQEPLPPQKQKQKQDKQDKQGKQRQQPPLRGAAERSATARSAMEEAELATAEAEEAAAAQEAAREAAARARAVAASTRPTPRGGESLWLLAMRACGDRVHGAAAVVSAMETCGELDLSPEGGIADRDVDVVLEYLRVCGRAQDVQSAVAGLRKLGSAAPPEAYVLTITTVCTGPAPNMDLATSTLDLAEASGALAAASAGQLLRLYCALVGGFGRRSNLDAAHDSFAEGLEWLNMAQQRQLRMRQEVELYAARRQAEAEAKAARAQGYAVGQVGGGGGATPAAGASQGSGGDAERDDAEGGDAEGGEWSEADWLAAERALHRVMVEAAAPHPRGLLLACTLLEQMARSSGQRLKHGYYSQLISGHATAHELHVALGALQGARRSGVSSSGWRVADSTIAALMDALQQRAEGLADAVQPVRAARRTPHAARRTPHAARRTHTTPHTTHTTRTLSPHPPIHTLKPSRLDSPLAHPMRPQDVARSSAVRTLGEAGLQMEQKVSQYLASGSELGGGSGRRSRRRSRQANANDDLVASERASDGLLDVGGLAPGVSAREAELRSARRIAAAGLLGDGDDAPPSPPLSAKVQYDEFEALLAQREERPHKVGRLAGEPRQERDTKRRVDARRLSNLGNLKGKAGNI